MSNKDDNKEVAVYEAIVNNTEIATTEDKKVPLSMVFGHGTLGNIESFGGKSLLENTMKVDEALANVEDSKAPRSTRKGCSRWFVGLLERDRN